LNFESTPKSLFFPDYRNYNAIGTALRPLPPASFPKKGRGRLVLIRHVVINHGIMMIRIPLPSLFGEGLGVGYNEG
ncbi:MAG: hypothetical protein WCK09_17905, partial [Bacteroidota bacterium]